MAVKKKNTEVDVEVAVETPVDTPVDVVAEVPTVSDAEVVEEKPTEEPVEDTLEVNAKVFDVPEETNCKIRMRVDHRCTVAMVRYDLKKGQVYTVPKNVKNILNRAGLLAPLN